MNPRVVTAVIVTFFATSAYADHAQPRGGSSARPSGGGHPSGGAPVSGAQARHPRAGYGTGARYGYYGYHGHHYPYYYGHYPYYGYYGGYYPWYGYYGWPYWGLGLSFSYNSGGYYAPYYPADGYAPGYAYDDSAPAAPCAIRLLVDPPEARVYVGQLRGSRGRFRRNVTAPVCRARTP